MLRCFSSSGCVKKGLVRGCCFCAGDLRDLLRGGCFYWPCALLLFYQFLSLEDSGLLRFFSFFFKSRFSSCHLRLPVLLPMGRPDLAHCINWRQMHLPYLSEETRPQEEGGESRLQKEKWLCRQRRGWDTACELGTIHHQILKLTIHCRIT